MMRTPTPIMSTRTPWTCISLAPSSSITFIIPRMHRLVSSDDVRSGVPCLSDSSSISLNGESASRHDVRRGLFLEQVPR